MKSDVMSPIAQIDHSILKNIIEVKETIATGIELGKQPSRTFGVIDLWNIRRNAKLATTMVRRH